MNLIQNSEDLLNVIIAFSILLLTFFICWVLFYVARSLYNVFKITKEARESLIKAKEVLDLLKKKLNSTMALVRFTEEVANRFLDGVKKYQKKSSSKKQKKTSSRERSSNKKSKK